MEEIVSVDPPLPRCASLPVTVPHPPVGDRNAYLLYANPVVNAPVSVGPVPNPYVGRSIFSGKGTKAVAVTYIGHAGKRESDPTKVTKVVLGVLVASESVCIL